MQWNIIKERPNDEIFAAKLSYFKDGNSVLLYDLLGGNVTNVNAKREFDTRISAELLEQKKYLVTLGALQYTDTHIFQLAGAVSRLNQNSDTAVANVTINKIEGTLDLLFLSPPKV